MRSRTRHLIVLKRSENKKKNRRKFDTGSRRRRRRLRQRRRFLSYRFSRKRCRLVCKRVYIYIFVQGVRRVYIYVYILYVYGSF